MWGKMKMYRIAGVWMTFFVSAVVAMDQSSKISIEQETPKGWILEGSEVPPLHLSSPSHSTCQPCNQASSSSHQSSKNSGSAVTLSQSNIQSAAPTTFWGSLISWIPWSKEHSLVQATSSCAEQTTPSAPALEIFRSTENKQQSQEEELNERAFTKSLAESSDGNDMNRETLTWAQRVVTGALLEQSEKKGLQTLLRVESMPERLGHNLSEASNKSSVLMPSSQSSNSLRPSKSRARRARRKLKKEFSSGSTLVVTESVSDRT